MMVRTGLLFFAALLLSLVTPPAAAVDVHDTRLLTQPAVSRTHVAFIYADDLWIVERGGEAPLQARRLTSHPGVEQQPRFSPDGKLVAFSGEYDGNVDVFVVPVDGGAPRRLTWHPGSDVVQGFTPDGAAVLFSSARASYTWRHRQLFTVPLEGGMPEQLPIPHGWAAAWSPDGRKIAYRPQRDVFEQWKNYRGGTHGRIWIYDVGDYSVVEVPQPEGRCNDTAPMWLGGDLYFLSDRAGELNLFRYAAASGEVTQLTSHADFPVLTAGAGDGVVVYEQAGYLHAYDPAAGGGAGERLRIAAAADLRETRPRFASGREWVRSFDLSPSAARAVLEFRGEIVTVPAEKGDPHYVTRTPGVHERSPIWSPDGRRLAWFSDTAGEYQLQVADAADGGEVASYPLGGAGFYERPVWAPDGKKVSFVDNSHTLYWLDLGSGAVKKVDADVLYGPFNEVYHAWSPDSRWLAYTRNNRVNFQQLYLAEVETGVSRLVTDGLSNVSEPVFDPSGKYLYFFASTNAGPIRTWFAQSNNDAVVTHELYLAVLQQGVPSPLARQSDEEEGEVEGDGDEEGGDAAGDGEADRSAPPPRVEVDFDGLGARILAVPVARATLSHLQVGGEGELFFLHTVPAPGQIFDDRAGELRRYDLEQREERTLLTGVDGYAVSRRAPRKVLALTADAAVIGDATKPLDPAAGKLDLAAVQVRVEPLAEWRQIYDEVWRINRDYFYDPGMHGADWPAMREKYARFLPDLATRSDLARLIRWLCSELAVGHHRTGGGDHPFAADEVPVGLLGADYEVDAGRYRFREVYGGLNWDPELRAPLTEPGVGVKTGEYLLAVDGRDLRPPENLYGRFAHTVGRIVELTVGPDPSGRGARTVRAVPIADEDALRHRAWIEGNLRRVSEATGGRVAYVHVPNTADLGHATFKRYFFPQADKDAIIIDDRYNAGGQFADYYVDLLRRPLIGYSAMRYGIDLKAPLGSIQGPKVMLIDETAGSGGDLLPWIFRQLEMGPLVGKRTWGGLVGVLGFPTLMDGGAITAPNFALWAGDGFIVENVGVPPDVEVEQLPAEVIAGRDPQLEKAIELVLEALAKSPPHEAKRPPYPIRVRR